MTDLTPTLERVGHQLVAGIPRYERTRRARRFAVAGLAGLVVTAAIGWAVALSDTSDTDVRIAPRPPAAVPDGIGIERISGPDVPAVLFATSGNAGGIAAIDLLRGVRATYAAGEHGAAGAPDGAVFTRRGELLVWDTDGSVGVYPAGRSPDGASELLESVGGPRRDVGTITGERTVVPTDDGELAWMLGGFGQPSLALELVDLTTGVVRFATTVAPSSRLIDAVGRQAVIDPDVSAADRQVLLVEPSGAVSTIEAPEPGRFVAATRTESIWIAGGDLTRSDGERLLIVDAQGQVATVEPPAAGQWVRTGSATIPSNSPDLRTLTTGGARLLLGLTRPEDPTGETDRVVVVDLERRRALAVYEGTGASSAFWARDDETVVVIGRRGSGDEQVVEAVNAETGSRSTIESAIPDGFFVIAGG